MILNNQQLMLMEFARILAGSDNAYEAEKMIPVLEDTTSPVTVRSTERLLDQVIKKQHVFYDGIDDSKGDITQYKGYPNMKEILSNIKTLSAQQKMFGAHKSANEYADIVLDAIKNIEGLRDVYAEGFQKGIAYTQLEYCTFVCCCVEATTAILCDYVDYVKNPSTQVIEIKPKNTKYRPNALYFEQLKKFNELNKSADYRKFLEQMNAKGGENFTGAELIGLGTILLVAGSIVPVTRALVYHFYNCRRKLSDSLAVQAMYLEIHRTALEANQEFSKEKRDKIIAKQDKVRKMMLKLSDKIRVTDVQAARKTKQDLEKDNKLMTFNTVKNDVDNGSFDLL